MTIDIKKFCGNDATIRKEKMEWTRLPWRSGENLRATNGHIMIEIYNADEPEVDQPPENIALCIDGWLAEPRPADDQWLSIPALPEAEPCQDCNGIGIWKNESGDEYDCDWCNGSGEQQQRIELGNTGFSIRYLRLLQSLPNARIAPNEMDKAPFEFDGGRGILMPMRR